MLPLERQPTRFFGWLGKGVGLSREAPFPFLCMHNTVVSCWTTVQVSRVRVHYEALDLVI